MTQVTLHHLSKRYDQQHHAVRDLTLALAPGRVTALLGPSGCGKTTTLKMIAGLLPPTAGDIQFDGQSVLSVPAEQRGAVMVFQNHLLFPYLSVGENVGFGLKMRGQAQAVIRQRVAEMLALVRLPGYEARRPHQLSGGQAQRVALARALVVQPRLLLLDEPLSNLDAHLREEMRQLIREIQQALGITIIFVTHDQEEAVILADEIALLFEGQLHQFGPPHRFYEQPANERVARFFGSRNLIPGRKQGERVSTALGEFQVAASPLPDGPVLLTFRPESAALHPARPPADAANNVRVHVTGCVYAGTHTRWQLIPAGLHAPRLNLHAVSDPRLGAWLREGDNATLYLPPENIWLLPAQQDA